MNFTYKTIDRDGHTVRFEPSVVDDLEVPSLISVTITARIPADRLRRATSYEHVVMERCSALAEKWNPHLRWTSNAFTEDKGIDPRFVKDWNAVGSHVEYVWVGYMAEPAEILAAGYSLP